MKANTQQPPPPSGRGKGARRSPTVRTVAQHAGVSVATVSRTLSRLGPVNPETARRVHQAIKELGFSLDHQASSLRSGRSRLFGIIVPRIANPLLLDLIQHIDRTAVDSGYEILVSSIDLEPEQLTNALQRMMVRRVEGVILLSSDVGATPLVQKDGNRLPIVCINPESASPGMCSVRIDYETGMRQAVQHLHALGHRSICFVRGEWKHRYAHLRWEAFEKIMQSMDLPRGMLARGESFLLSTDELLTLLADGRGPTAAICVNDLTAMELLQRATQIGLRVPDDLSIIGIDDNQFSRSTFPELTTVRFPSKELASAAIQALIKVPSANDPHDCDITLATSLVIRQSVGPWTAADTAKIA